MSIGTTLALLAEYQPLPQEIDTNKLTIINFIKKYEQRAFERSLLVGHITASAWLLNKNRTHALIMHHAKLHKWLQLGGHCDGNSDILAVAIKEAQEESGINNIVALQPAIFDLDIHEIPANAKEAEHYHYDIRFLLGVESNEEIVQNHESKELRWISKEDCLPLNSDASVARMFYKWRQLSINSILL